MANREALDSYLNDRSLNHVADSRPELAEFDLASLIVQAVGQRARLEPFRLEAAAGALGPARDPA